MNIIEGIIEECQKVVVYGPQGIGKSTMGMGFPDPLFFDTERGSRRLPVKRTAIESLDDFKTKAQEIIKSPESFRQFKSIVVDTGDWLEAKAKEKVVSQYSAKDRAYDREGSYIGDEMMKILLLLDDIVKAGFHVVVLSHSATVRVDLPDQPTAFDRYELDMNKKHVAPIVKHWADHLLFLRHKITVREPDDSRNKGVGGEHRLLCLSTTASYDAKTRSTDPTLKGEFLIKDPSDAVEVVRRIFESVKAPWGTPTQPPTSVTVSEEEKLNWMKEKERKEKAPKKSPVPATTSAAGQSSQDTGSKPNVPQPEKPSQPMTDGIPGLAPENGGPAPIQPHPMDAIIGLHEDAVNAFLVKRNEIKAGQTYRDVKPDYAARVMKNPAGFFKAAGIGEGVAA